VAISHVLPKRYRVQPYIRHREAAAGGCGDLLIPLLLPESYVLILF